MIFLPESPRWLLANGKNEECLAALSSIAGEKNRNKAGFIEAEYRDIELLVGDAAAAGKSSFFSSFNPKGKALYRTMLGFLLMVCQQLTGANYFFYYGIIDVLIHCKGKKVTDVSQVRVSSGPSVYRIPMSPKSSSVLLMSSVLSLVCGSSRNLVVVKLSSAVRSGRWAGSSSSAPSVAKWIRLTGPSEVC